MSMGRMRGERDTVFRRMDFIEGPRPFQKVKIQPFRAARRCIASNLSVMHDQTRRIPRTKRRASFIITICRSAPRPSSRVS
jgi:hypothetical protein